MAKHRTHSVEFKRQVSQEYLGGETLHGLSKRHDVSRNLIRILVDKFQAGALDEDVASADLLGTYEARIAALVEPADQVEQQLAAGLREREVTAFVENDEVQLG